MIEMSQTFLPKAASRKTKKENSAFRESPDLIHSARLGKFSPSAARYTSSIAIDPRIFEAVVNINKAHVIMLAKQKIIPLESEKELLCALNSVPSNMKLDDLLEDVHMNIEDFVISRIGKDAGGMLNLAKSRNDQVATALRIALRESLLVIGRELVRLEEVLLSKASANTRTVMPGYTHLQRAQPITVAHHLLAHEQALERDTERLLECYARVNYSPMGAGALASSSFKVDRKWVASLLGFKGVLENSADAVSARDFAIESIFVCAQIMIDVSKIAEEIILWTSREFSFAKMSDSFAATSSMMPQKKNSIVPEVAKARVSQVTGDLTSAFGIVKSLPLTYNNDLQELSWNMWSAIDKTRDTLSLFSDMISELEFNPDEMKNAVENDETLFATEVADYLVAKFGIPFREAHKRVGSLVRSAEADGSLSRVFTKSGKQKISSILGVDISDEELARVLDPLEVLGRRTNVGSPNPRIVKKSLMDHSAKLKKFATSLNSLEQDQVSKNATLRALVETETRRAAISMTRSRTALERTKSPIQNNSNVEGRKKSSKNGREVTN